MTWTRIGDTIAKTIGADSESKTPVTDYLRRAMPEIDWDYEEPKPRRKHWREILGLDEKTFIGILTNYYTSASYPYKFDEYFNSKVSPASQIIWRRCMTELTDNGWYRPLVVDGELQFLTLSDKDLRKRFHIPELKKDFPRQSEQDEQEGWEHGD